MRSHIVALLAAGLAVVACKSSSSSPPTDGPPSTNDSGDTGTAANCPAAEDLISDFEVDNALAPVDGRQGGWYTYGDTEGHFVTGGSNGYNIDGAGTSCSPNGSLHVQGMGFGMWGAATGVDWKPRPAGVDGGYGDKMTYDASKYSGVSFYAKASTMLAGVQVAFPDLYTDGASAPHDMPDPSGGANPLCTACRCIYNAASEYNCSPYLVQFGLKGDAAADVAFASYGDVQIETTWKRITIRFADTKQDPGNGGYHTMANKLSTDKLTAMAIQVNADYSTGTSEPRDFELWIDDVAFIK